MGELFPSTVMLTHSGQVLDLLSPDPTAIAIEDIARGLSRCARFAGQTVGAAYSVAQHSVLVADQCSPDAALVGLLHDAAEAYMKDLPRPLKLLFGDKAKDIESGLWRAIRGRFRLGPFSDAVIAEVKRIDEVLLATEARDLMIDSQNWESANLPAPLDQPIDIWSESWSYVQFVRRFWLLNTDLRSAE